MEKIMPQEKDGIESSDEKVSKQPKISKGKAPEEKEIEEKIYDLSKIADQINMFKDNLLSEDDIKNRIAKHIEKILISYNLKEEYRIIFLYDKHNSINGYHSDRIYRAISDLDNKSNILMFIESGGGKIEPAYLISKTCKRLAKNKFSVSVPRRAKSAATLISLGATEIHMGHLSELGPIDPQINGFPALGLANAIEKIADMTERFPKASDIFAKYLIDKVNIRDLGYFERINESATQYAIRLLTGKEFTEGQTCETLAAHFTNHYKDHGFVIDSEEAANLLGNNVVKINTKEYKAGDKIYEFLHFIDILFSIFKQKNMCYVGGVNNGIDISEKDD